MPHTDTQVLGLAAWRHGVSPGMTTAALRLLEAALAANDPSLIQGLTVRPKSVPQQPVFTPADAACPTVWPCWKLDRIPTAADLWTRAGVLFGEAAARLLAVPDQHLHLSHFLCFWDRSPREEVVAALLAEVRAELVRRGSRGIPAPTDSGS